MRERVAKTLYEIDPLPGVGDGTWDVLLTKEADRPEGIGASIIADHRAAAAAALEEIADLAGLTHALGDACGCIRVEWWGGIGVACDPCRDRAKAVVAYLTA